MKTIYSTFILALFCSIGFSQSVNITVDYGFTGNCAVCGTFDFACSNGFGGWNNGNASFNDPVPVGNVVTSVEADVYFVAQNVSASLLLNGEGQTAIGLYGTLACGGCSWSTVNIAGPFTSYVYGGVNQLQVLAVNMGGWICVDRIELKINYEPECDVVVDAGDNQIVYYGYPPAATATLSASITGGDAPISVTWYDEMSNVVGTGASINVSPQVSTTYTVEVVDANGCEATDIVRVCVIDVRCGNNNTKVQLCHSDGGSGHTICVAQAAVPAHLSHGDMLGSCEEQIESCELLFNGHKPTLIVNSNTNKARALENEPTLRGVEHQVLENDHGMKAGQSGLSILQNPFANQLAVNYTTFMDDQVSINLFDVNGKLVSTLFKGSMQAFEARNLTFDATTLSNGIYFCQLQTSFYSDRVKVVKTDSRN